MKSKVFAVLALLLAQAAYGWWMWQEGNRHKLERYVVATHEGDVAVKQREQCLALLSRANRVTGGVGMYLLSTQELMGETYRRLMERPAYLEQLARR